MNLPKTKLYEATGDKHSATKLQGVFYDPKAKRFAASDGFILVTYPIRENGGFAEPRIIPTEAMERAYKSARGKAAPEIEMHDDHVVVDGEKYNYITMEMPLLDESGEVVKDEKGNTVYAEQIVTDFPDADQIIPDESKADYIVSLDVDLLYRTALAICEDGSKSPPLHVNIFREPGNRKAPLLIKPITYQSEGAVGVVMPLNPLNGAKTTARQKMETLMRDFKLEFEQEFPKESGKVTIVRVLNKHTGEALVESKSDELTPAITGAVLMLKAAPCPVGYEPSEWYKVMRRVSALVEGND